MARIENSIEIKASPEKVWEMLALDRYPEWTDSVKSVEYTSEVNTPKDKYRVGASAQGGDCNFEITESLENEKMTRSAYENTFLGTLSYLVTYTLEPVESDTKFTYAYDSELPWGIFGKFLEKLFVRRWVEKMLWTEVENLKSILEK